ncbi:zinc finger protein 709-like [Actinia tenebrosa]|uniref:Zinc finger protein 709-like n=1 Tax=Actinia tenebrosa TaxID=6105 RepID=A0A6P8J208_ACTTE|nr:zinc finger protein 709-like [Actinia tenebrosa]
MEPVEAVKAMVNVVKRKSDLERTVEMQREEIDRLNGRVKELYDEMCGLKRVERFGALVTMATWAKESVKDFMRCKRVFSTKQRLQYHIRNGVCIRRLVGKTCRVCNKEFSTPQKLRYHIENGVCRRTTECSYCGKIFSSYQRLRTHRKRHDGAYKHLSRDYSLDGVDCYQCGDLMSCCEHKDDYLKDRIDYFNEIGRAFPRFDVVEGVPWTNREYWRSECGRCGCIREEEHIFNCLTKS